MTPTASRWTWPRRSSARRGGRLFLTLREQRSLAYSVWADALDDVDGGLFSAGLSCSPDRADEARAALEAELARLADEGPSDEEVSRARRMLAGQLAAGLQRVATRASDLASSLLYGIPYGLEAYRTALTLVTPQAVRAALLRFGVGRPLTLVVRPER